MTLKTIIMALFMLCASLFAQAVAPSVAPDTAQGRAAVSAGGNVETSAADEDDESEDEEPTEAPAEADFEVSTTPLLRGKTGIEAIDTLPVNEWDIPTKRNSLKYAMLFSLLPGGGQYYTEHYVRGGFLTGIERFLQQVLSKRSSFRSCPSLPGFSSLFLVSAFEWSSR